jgi:ABC-type multidrug transport system permease subunit
MLNASVCTIIPKRRPFRGWLIVAYVVVISIAIDSVLLLSAGSERSWKVLAVTVLSVALISAGALFSALEMPKLGRSRQAR